MKKAYPGRNSSFQSVLNSSSRNLRSGTRVLSDEERQIWDHVASRIQPLKSSHRRPKSSYPAEDKHPFPENPPADIPAAPKKQKKQTRIMPFSALPVPQKEKPVPSLSSVERKTLRALKKGQRNVEAKLDLHGLYQEEAFYALKAFLHRSSAHGKTIVLVVTGKGKQADTDFSPAFDGRGILRRMLPHWLASPELRQLVLGYEEASIRHGGSGAYYVRLRKS